MTNKRSAKIAVAKKGKNVLNQDTPNEKILDSDTNSFKILYQGTKDITFSSGDNTIAIDHHAPRPFPCILIFIRFPDGYVTQLTREAVGSYNYAYLQTDFHSINDTWWDDSQIFLFCAGVVVPYTISVSWFVFEPNL